MTKFSKSFVVVLAVIFTGSLVLHLCCHQDWSELLVDGNHAKAAAHSHSHDHSNNDSSKDECGPHKYKDVVKTGKLNTPDSPPASSAVNSFTISFQDWAISDYPQLLKIISFRLGFFNKAGPRIHLLNSVFLN